jgi:hypothetical protein
MGKEARDRARDFCAAVRGAGRLCRNKLQSSARHTRPSEISAFAIPDDGYRRAEGDSYLTYPEWYIVHAYTDLAGMTRQASESAFDYLAGIFGFWTSLCHATIAAGRIGEATVDQRTTNYIIGLSFTAEMVLIGLYERSIGAATAWARGAQRTAEDEFALAVADDYAAFLQQTPWYRYPFWLQMRVSGLRRRGDAEISCAASSVGSR